MAIGVLGVLCTGAAHAEDVPPGLVGDSIGIRIVDVPAVAAADPRARLYIVDHVQPGSQITRRIEVSATADTGTPVEIYAAAASITAGAFAIAEGREANELSSWVSVNPSAAYVPARGTVIATVTITVPSTASVGEQYAVLWAESSSPATLAGGIRYVTRVGIRMYVDIGPGGDPPTDFEITELTASRSADGLPVVIADVLNTGGRALDLRGSLTLASGPAGLAAGPFPLNTGVTVALDSSEQVRFDLAPELPPGPWHATLSLTSGLTTRTAESEMTFPGSSVQAAKPTQPGPSPWVPWTLALVSVILASGLVASLAVRGSTLAGPWSRP